MAHANAAYANGNDAQLRELLLKWQADPHAIEGDDVVAQLIRAIRLIAWVKNRTTQVKQELTRSAQNGCVLSPPEGRTGGA